MARISDDFNTRLFGVGWGKKELVFIVGYEMTRSIRLHLRII